MKPRINYNLLVGANENTHGHCPNCHTSFDNGDIPEEHRHWYSKPHKWSRLIGIELPGVYDGTVLWQCPICKFTWMRFSGEALIRDDIIRNGGARIYGHHVPANELLAIIGGVQVSTTHETNQNPTMNTQS